MFEIMFSPGKTHQFQVQNSVFSFLQQTDETSSQQSQRFLKSALLTKVRRHPTRLVNAFYEPKFLWLLVLESKNRKSNSPAMRDSKENINNSNFLLIICKNLRARLYTMRAAASKLPHNSPHSHSGFGPTREKKRKRDAAIHR